MDISCGYIDSGTFQFELRVRKFKLAAKVLQRFNTSAICLQTEQDRLQHRHCSSHLIPLNVCKLAGFCYRPRMPRIRAGMR